MFGSKCPDELKDVCIIHEYMDTPEPEMLKVGNKLQIGQYEYIIESVGNVANKNLYSLGHIMISFSPEVEILPGSILVSPYVVPEVKTGDIIQF